MLDCLVQSTDKKVNEITPALFAVAADAPAMAGQQVGITEARTCRQSWSDLPYMPQGLWSVIQLPTAA